MEAIQHQMLHSNIIIAAVENVKILEKQLKIQKKEIEDLKTIVHELNQKLEDTKKTESSAEVKSLKAQISGIQRELKEEQEMRNSKPRLFHHLTTKIIALEMKNKKLDDALLEYKRDAAAIFGNMIQENPCYSSNDRELVTMNEWLKKHDLCDGIPPPLPYNLRRNELYF